MTPEDIALFKLACLGTTAFSTFAMALATSFLASQVGYLRGPRGYPGRVGRAGKCICAIAKEKAEPKPLEKEATRR